MNGENDLLTERQLALRKRRRQMQVDARNSGDDIESPELGTPSELRRNYRQLLRNPYEFPASPLTTRTADDIIAESGCNQIADSP